MAERIRAARFASHEDDEESLGGIAYRLTSVASLVCIYYVPGYIYAATRLRTRAAQYRSEEIILTIMQPVRWSY